ncbi:hypothetical protein Sme01_03810 [Sphaerisporangium melleum]|uniref:YspA cpYpsA-related SLOG domain-containing protein n=1 Tax=Sphaerisporangium melleum TaxID=321316 RepID=A0A917QPH7_9ACTN|nr:DUF2493 domain-containing protein [Sphaerisporangium melleum]GGK61942.1 hypothetical protein GCM10007964_01360 [Sphaerisporangium melleum]GII67905.1 hypothetical protein Sme01_03810 [Sphaerisporangium melleum]
MPRVEPYRVLVTGSRSWRDEQTIRDALAGVVSRHGPESVVVVHGHAYEGADAIADRIASAWAGLSVERHPADWDTCADHCHPAHRRQRLGGSTYCPTAGLRRDAEMVETGPDEVLAFIDPCRKPRCRGRKPHGSHGATHTADLAEKAGIPVRRFP